MNTLFAAIHHAAVLALFVCALVSIYHLHRQPSLPGAHLLRMTDIVNGAAATLVLVVGLVRVFYLEKGAVYYLGNAPFLVKMALYGLVSLLSLVPTLEMRRWRIPLKSGQLPIVSEQKIVALRAVAYLQLACLAAMALCAHLAARGLGGLMA